MSEMDAEEQRKLLRQQGWIPVEDKPLGEGGGARVFKVVSGQTADRFITPLLCPMDREKAVPLAQQMAQIIGDIVERDAHTTAAGKVARTEEFRTKREIEILRDVQHPNFIRLIDYDKSDKPRWYVMPVMKHGTLKDRAKTLKGNFAAVVRGMAEVADALGALHLCDKSIVHRDIKPANVFIGERDSWILGDPGSAYRDDGGDPTTTRPVSKDWFPRWYDDTLGHSPLVDLYMLGAVGFYCLTGEMKPLDPSFLKRERFDLPNLYAKTPGARETYDLLCSVVKSEPTEIPIKNGAQFASQLREVLHVVEQTELYRIRTELRRMRDEPRLLFNYSGPGNDSGDALALQRAAIWIPGGADRLSIWITSKHDNIFQLDVLDTENKHISLSSGPLKNHESNEILVPESIRGTWQCFCLRGPTGTGTGKVTRLAVYSMTIETDSPLYFDPA